MLKFELEICQTAAVDSRQRMGVSGTKLLFSTPAPVDMASLRPSTVNDKELEHNIDLLPPPSSAFFPVPTPAMTSSYS